MKWLPVLFLTAVVFLHRPAMLGGVFSDATTIFPRWDLALLAGAFLLLQWERLFRILKSLSATDRVCIVLLLLSALGHFFRNGFFSLESLGLNLVFLTVPLFACVNKALFLRILPWFLSLLWLLTSVAFLTQRLRDIAGVGIPGNWNWNATLLLVTGAFTIFLIFRLLRTRGKTGALLCSLPVGAVTLMLFLWSGSRASCLGLAVTLLLFLLLSLDARRRKLLFLACGILFAAGIVLLTTQFQAKIDSFMAAEIRPILWESVVRMIGDHPLGVGAESFEDCYIPYKSVDYFLHDHASPRTIHPHNEFLNIAVLLGIPALLAWCFLTFQGFFRFLRGYRHAESEMKLLFFCLILMLTHAMLDLIFFSWPQDMIGFLFTGIFWAPRMCVGETHLKFRCLPRIAGIIALAGVLLSGLNNFRATWNFERALDASRAGNPEQARKYALAGAALSGAFPEHLYRCAERALLFDRDYPLALKLAERMEQTPGRNFSRIHMLKAMALASLGRDEEAKTEYERESRNYPYLILPVIGRITCCGRLGRSGEIPALEQKLGELMKLRNLSSREVRLIMRHPECDLNQHKLGLLPEWKNAPSR